MIKLAVSPGDPAGIGPDICIKAFGSKKKYDFVPVIFGDLDLFQDRAKKLNCHLEIKEYLGQKELNKEFFWIYQYPLDIKVEAGKPDPTYSHYLIKILEDSVKKTLNNEFDALVTGPLNKELINKGGINFQGHTEVLAKLTGTPKVLMMLTSGHLKVALVTTHIPLSEVAKFITYEHLVDCIKTLSLELKKKWGIKNPHIKVLGLNPHAGEGGYLGREDIDIIYPVINDLKNKGYNLTGPVSADTAFLSSEGENVDAILAMYHDQGLPVLKTSGFGSSVNTTLGLPFIRTSVDHGTAYDMAGRKEVDENSLIEASLLASKLATSI